MRKTDRKWKMTRKFYNKARWVLHSNKYQAL